MNMLEQVVDILQRINYIRLFYIFLEVSDNLRGSRT